MMKYILTLIFALVVSAACYSQGLYTLDYNMSYPVGKTGDFTRNTSFRGFTFEGRGFISDNISLGGLFNWTTFYEELDGASFTYETATITGNQYRYINAFPILFQAHYYLGLDENKLRAYLGGGLGAYIIIQRVNMGIWSMEYNKWHFGFSPEAGVLIPVSMGTQINISLRYHHAFKAKDTIDYSWFGLSVGFAWGN